MGDQVTIHEIYTDGITMSHAENASHSYSERARRHLWLQMSRMGAYDENKEIPIMVRGEGTRGYDANGTEYFDGLSGLFTNMLGHGRREIAEAAAEQMNTMAFFPLWTYAHPKAIDLAEKIASLAPGDLNRVFFTTGGAEANESAWKLARQYHKMRGDSDRYKVISRDIAYHGTTLGALTITSLEGYRQPFEPLVPGAVKVPAVNFYRAEKFADDFEAFGMWSAHQIEEAILREGPETVAAVFLESVQNAGGCFTPPPGYWQEVRSICDRYGVLLVADDVICAFGRLGTWFGAQKYDYVPDVITCAKGITAGYAPLGAMIVSELRLRTNRCHDCLGPHRRTFPARRQFVHSRLHLVGSPRVVCGRPGEHQDHGRRKSLGERAREPGLLPRPTRRAQGPSYCGRRTRHRLLLGRRARQEPDHEGDVGRSRRRTTASRLRLARDVPSRPDLSLGRPR